MTLPQDILVSVKTLNHNSFFVNLASYSEVDKVVYLFDYNNIS